jgi:hypothetical protein
MPWKFESVKAKLPGVLKAAGLQFDDKQAEACVTAVAALMPESEMFTSEETQGVIHTAREEARSAREAATALLEKVTGMRRDQFAEQDRFKLMQTAADERLAALQKENETFKAQFEPMKKQLDAYQTAESQAVAQQYEVVKKRLDSIFAVAENKTKYAGRFKFAEAGKTLSVEDMKANVEAFDDLRSLDVPAFQDGKQPPEGTPSPRPGGGAQGNSVRRMTAKELAQKRADMGIH